MNEDLFSGKKILISGGSGSWGNELTKQILEQEPEEIIIYSRGELAQVNMERKFRNPKVKYVIGDVRDYETLRRSMKGVDYVFALSALKHVPVCENQPQEAIKTNIDGTTNTIHAAIENGVKHVIDVSTDKSCLPINLYGMTKAIGEKLIIQANNLSSTTKFSCVRGGNVLGSNGSVVPYFIDQIKKFNKVTITDSRMTRYFLTLSDAIQLLFKATKHSIGGETFVMNMPSFFIKDLAEVLIDYYGNDTTQIEEIGIREGEKLHEMLVSEHESPNTYEFDDDYYSILPTIKIDTMNSILTYYKFKNIEKVNFKQFTSQDNLKGKRILKDFLATGGFLR
jgi:FlaA1/EpsC-like NDP-sugar epimerase